VRLGDPSESEFIVVRLGRDEVPFAPSELAIPGRKAVPAARSATRARQPRAATRRVPSKRVPPLVVTMRFRDDTWTVEAQQGARRLAKPMPLRPGAVSAFAEHVDDAAVRGALVETVEACRAVVAERAASLRAELDAAEAALRAYESRPSRPKRSRSAD
jgi:hypothetical protein